MSRRALGLFLLLAAGCTRAGGHDDGGRPAAPPRPAPAPAGPMLAADEACPIEYATRVEADGAAYRVTVTATNRSGAALAIELPDRCPAGPIALTGLPAGADPYQACQRGACLATAPTLTWSVAAGATVELATMTIDPAGDACNAALPAGRYTLSFSPPAAHAGCAPAPGVLEHRVKSKPAPDKKEKKPAPREPSDKPKDKPRCEPMPACGIGCPGPMAKDENGCTLCACEEDPFSPRVAPAP